MLKIGNESPDLKIKLTNGKDWNLKETQSNYMKLVVFYRGKHCPVCKTYLEELNDNFIEKFKEIGVNEIIAISADTEEKAKISTKEWSLDKTQIGYGLNEQTMREWGLYISSAIKDEETPIFSEPGLFLLKPDSTIFYAAYNSMPFGRPKFEDMYKAVKFVKDKDYPARGIVS